MSAKRIKTRHAGIYQRGNRYVFMYRDRDAILRSGSARTLDEAIKARRALMVRVDRGEDVAPSTETFASYSRRWVNEYQGGRNGFRAKTRDDYRRELERRLIPQLGHLPISKIRKRNVKELIRWLCDDEAQGKHLTDRTVRRILAPLSSCLRTAAEDELIESNPVTGLRIPPRDETRAIEQNVDTIGRQDDEQARALTESQTADLIANVPAAYRPLITLLAVTGLRISEALALRWGDLELDGDARLFVNRMVTINPESTPGGPWWHFQPPKSRAGKRSVPIPRDLADELQRRRVETIAEGKLAGDRDLAFQARNGAPIAQNNLRRRAFTDAAQSAGVGWAGFHTLRHTCASRLFAEGMNPKQIAKWLGHSDAAFTMRTYVHLLADDVPVALTIPPAEGGHKVATPGRFGGVRADTAAGQKVA
jgi:integrase